MAAQRRPTSSTHVTLRDIRAQPFRKLRPTPPARDVTHSDSDGLLLPNQNHKPLAAGDAGVEQITLQHGIVLRHDRNYHGWVFRALALVDACGVARHHGVELAKAIAD